MTKETSFFRKILIITLFLLFICSSGFNIYQHSRLDSERKNNSGMAEYYMREHELTFTNVFAMAGNTEIMEYIKTPNHLSAIIEGIQIAEFNYLAASKYKENLVGGSILSRNLILNGYLSELRAYRNFLESINSKSYEDINQLQTDLADLQTISSWLLGKYNNNDFQVYTDKDFYGDVYLKLKSNIKSYYF
ncbi:hypothetical protein [Paenibacillus nasutitermitis]|uniref:Uncharacterized protein n=1 Tax=Paenibacillus nasutitermitis TaxID=1652958 RepID=A0A916YR90_9BACL|nr:hypothetical protein [Paenibacillus nasutitermitis]GGD57866.1 hypothetical protein GCM10010911_14570 [Paenibacillus nasutitermitis]